MDLQHHACGGEARVGGGVSRIAPCSSVVEQRISKPLVAGSIPAKGSFGECWMRKYSTQLGPGDKYGEWTLLRYQASETKNGKRLKRARWLCRCSCGVEKEIAAENIMDVQAKLSCGHLPIRSRKDLDHDMTSKVVVVRSTPLPIGAVNSVFQLGLVNDRERL